MGCKVIHKTVMALSCTLLLTAWAAPVPAQESHEKAAREMVEGVLRKTKKSPAGDLGAWSRSVIKRALERAGEKRRRDPRPPPGRGPSRPPGKQFSHASPRTRGHRLHEPLGPRCELGGNGAARRRGQASRSCCAGLAPKDSRPRSSGSGRILREGAGAAIDPRLFRLFGITAIPAVAVVPGGVPPCASRGCAEDAAPPHDRIGGNIGLEAALSIIAAEGGPGRATARRHLAKLRGDSR